MTGSPDRQVRCLVGFKVPRRKARRLSLRLLEYLSFSNLVQGFDIAEETDAAR